MVETRASVAADLFNATENVIGQERARKQLAVMLSRQIEVSEGIWPKADAGIICGWTGTGKSYMTRMMCDHSGLPFADVNATQYTETGYAGEDLSQMFLPLLENAAKLIDEEHARHASGLQIFEPPEPSPPVLKRNDIDQVVERAQTGVVLLDEFDKYMQRYNHHTGRLDTAIQSELLKMIEGSTVYVSGDEDEIGVPFDTSRVLVLCAGAFVGLSQQVLRRMERDREFMHDEGFWQLIEQSDFVKFGIIPELAGRLSKMIFLRPLRKDDLARIIMLPHGPVDELKQRFENQDCEWQVPNVAITYLADIALQKQVGARGIDTVLWQAFSEALFNASVALDPIAVRLAVNQIKAELVKV